MSNEWELSSVTFGKVFNILVALITTTWLMVLTNFVLLCYIGGCYKCIYDQEALLVELDTRFAEQRVRINSEVIAVLVEQEIAHEITQRKLWTVENLLTQNRLDEAEAELLVLDGNEHLSDEEQFQVTMVLKQMERK